MRIEVHIDRLVVDGGLGLEGRHAAALREAVAAELARALAGWAAETVRTPGARAPLSWPVAPASAGRAIADALRDSMPPGQARR